VRIALLFGEVATQDKLDGRVSVFGYDKLGVADKKLVRNVHVYQPVPFFQIRIGPLNVDGHNYGETLRFGFRHPMHFVYRYALLQPGDVLLESLCLCHFLISYG